MNYRTITLCENQEGNGVFNQRELEAIGTLASWFDARQSLCDDEDLNRLEVDAILFLACGMPCERQKCEEAKEAKEAKAALDKAKADEEQLLKTFTYLTEKVKRFIEGIYKHLPTADWQFLREGNITISWLRNYMQSAFLLIVQKITFSMHASLCAGLTYFQYQRVLKHYNAHLVSFESVLQTIISFGNVWGYNCLGKPVKEYFFE